MGITLERTTLTAPDVSCGHCVASVKEAVGALPGIDRVEADADTKRIDVAFDPNRVSRRQIEAALADAGYPVQP